MRSVQMENTEDIIDPSRKPITHNEQIGMSTSDPTIRD